MPKPTDDDRRGGEDRSRMGILQTATRLARWMAFVGLAFGVVYSVGGLIYDWFTTGLNWGTAMAFGALVGMPVVFGAFGFVLGALIGVVVSGVHSVLDRTNQGED